MSPRAYRRRSSEKPPGRPRRWAPLPDGRPDEKYIYARCTLEEHARLVALAERERLTMSDLVRRCINAWLVEDSDDVPLLVERTSPDVVEGRV